MSCFDDLTRAVTYKYNDLLQKACASLFGCLNLNNFWYYKVTESGHFYFFGTHPPVCEYFAAQKFYLDFHYYRNPRFFQSGISLQKSIAHPEIVQLTGDLFDLHHSLLIIEKIKGGVEAFGFSSSCKDEGQLVRMMNELPLLRLFTRHFRNEHKSIFLRGEENQINLRQLIGATFDQAPSRLPSHMEQKYSLLKKWGFDFVDELSMNEMEIVKRLLDGYSARQIGDYLFRSKRTIEHALDRIKEKWCCDDKKDLIKKARELEDLGFF